MFTFKYILPPPSIQIFPYLLRGLFLLPSGVLYSNSYNGLNAPLQFKNHTSSWGHGLLRWNLLLLHTSWLLLYSLLLLYQFNNLVRIHSLIYLSGSSSSVCSIYKEVTFKGFNLVLIQLSRYVCKVLCKFVNPFICQSIILGQKGESQNVTLNIYMFRLGSIISFISR